MIGAVSAASGAPAIAPEDEDPGKGFLGIPKITWKK